jgi:hypothetical protein
MSTRRERLAEVVLPLPSPGPLRAPRQDLFALLALAVVHLFIFRGLLSGSETLYFDDFSRYQLPVRSLVAEGLRDLRLPLWNPYLWLGTPLAANPVAGAFYPPNWVLLGLGDVAALNVSVVLHLYLGGVFTYLLARERAGSGAASFAAAVGFSLGGIALSSALCPIYLYSLTWLPAALFCFQRALSGRSLWYGVMAGGSVALMVLGGDVQLPITTALVLGLVAVFDVAFAASGARLRRAGRAATVLLLAGATGAALAAVQLLPALELGGLSERALGIGAAERHLFSFHPARAAGLVLPHLFGVPLSENSYWGYSLGDGMRFWYFSVHAGTLLFAFALCAFRRGDGWTWGLAATLLVLFALSTGRHGPFYEPAAQVIPGLDQFRYPEKFLAPLAVLLPVLGAQGMARLQWGEVQTRALVLCAILALIGAAAWALEGTLRDAFAGFFRVRFLVETSARRIAHDGRNLFVFASIAALLLFAGRRGWVTGRRLLLALGAFAAADVAVAGSHLLWMEPASVLARPPAAASLLHPEGVAPPRVLRLPSLDTVPLHRTRAEWRLAQAHLRASLQPNHNVTVRIDSLLGYGAGSPVEVNVLFGGFDDREAPELAKVLATPWLLEPVRGPGPLPEIAVRRNEGALPRVRLCGAKLEEQSISKARALVREHDFSRRALVEPGEALFGGEPLPAGRAQALAKELPADGAGSARIVRFQSEEVLVHAEAQRPSLLVLAEGFFPGWRATLDGAEVPIFRADFLERAVAVPAGTHELRFTFESPAVALGARVSLATVGGLALLPLLLSAIRRRRERLSGRRAPPRDPDTPPPRGP